MKRPVLIKSAPAVITGLLLAVLGTAMASGRATVVVAVPAQPGPVDGTTQNSDEFMWRLFTEFAAPVHPSRRSPVVFETWASDADTFTTNPQWPGPDAPKKFQKSVLGTKASPHHSVIDVKCSLPQGAAVGNFPTSGTPTPCVAEEVKRNRPQFDYIVKNSLNTQAGLQAAYAKSFKVTMPTSAISVKGDWVPVQTLLQWIPQIGSLDNLKKLYYTNVSDNVEYALVSLHVSSRQNPNWVWATYEHQMTPGRCDDIGCFDTFGAKIPAVLPNKKAVNTQYGPCPKTAKLKALMAKANLSPVWENYCQKATMVDYSGPDGTPYVLGNAVIERIVGNGTVAASSCIGCHVYASFGSNGQASAAAQAILPYNPTGQPNATVLNGSLQYDFMWGVLLAP
jgi:hypothetical protein